MTPKHIEVSLYDASANLVRRFSLKPPLPRIIKITKILRSDGDDGEDVEQMAFTLECYNAEFALYICNLNLSQN